MCEYLKHPLFVFTLHPRPLIQLSLNGSDCRGDVWDGGKVASSLIYSKLVNVYVTIHMYMYIQLGISVSLQCSCHVGS